ncbi:tungstate/molybdate binding protein, partial [mine drainage metagenome]
MPARSSTSCKIAVAPAFRAATGYTLVGFAGGSQALANQISGKLRRADVFISAAPSVNDALMGKQNGDYVTWYFTFAQAPLVIGYNPKSAFAKALQTRPWYVVMQ